MGVRIDRLTKKFGSHAVIDGLSTDFQSGRISVLLGASGCGKTTTLRCIAGLETPDEGVIVVEDAEVFHGVRGVNLPPEKRNISMVFQSYAIWPHMTVAENVALPLRAHGVGRDRRGEQVGKALKLVGLSGLEQRMATQLSGGQQQRVALARSIVWPAGVILLDEPLSNLDAQLRVSTRRELRELQRELNSTMIFVTHDQEEAMSIADEIFLFHGGRILQRGPPAEVYRAPVNRYVAEFLGKVNFIAVVPAPLGDGRVDLRALQGEVIATVPASRVPDSPECVCVVRPQAWQIRSTSERGLLGRVRGRAFLGDREEIVVDTCLGEILVIALGRFKTEVGDEVRLAADPESVHILPRAD